MLKNEPALDDISLPEYPQVGDLLVVQGDKRMGLSKGLHSLAITRKRDEFLFHCSTLDGEKDDILIWAFEIIDWRKNP